LEGGGVNTMRTKRLVTLSQSARDGEEETVEAEDGGAVVRLTSEREVTELLAKCKTEKKKCVVNVSTTSCGPCKFLLPTFEKYAEENQKTTTFAKLFIDDNDETKAVASSWRVMQVPTYRLLDEVGEVHKQFTTGDPKKLGSALYLFLT
jgi:thioredoxin-like negative regulator of GroEL